MGNPYFQFKQFAVWHDQCAMKVGTDGVLLGAWVTPALSPSRVLDIGTGSGVIALMLAQRFPDAHIDAIDIDVAAVRQAEDNFYHSPFSERLRVQACRLQDWSGDPYDLIVSNPPYFVNSLKCPDKTRTDARHNNMLPFADLAEHSDRLLSNFGTISFVLPIEAEQDIFALARLRRLHCNRLTYVHTKVGKPAKRILTAFSRVEPPTPPVAEHLCLSEAGTTRSAAYRKLTEAFYL